MKNDLISVVLPVFNSENTITEALESILAQTHKNIEVIVTNDCSTDNTKKILDGYNKDKRFIFIKNKKNLGAAISRNKAIERSSGRYIAFIDSDDRWCNEKLTRQVRFMRLNNCPISCTGYARLINGSFEKHIQPPKYITHKKMLSSNFIGLSTAMIDVQKTGKRYFRELRAKEDYVFWLDLLREGFWACGLREILCQYTLNKKLLHRKNLALKQWKIFREIEKMDVLRSAYYFCNYAVRGIKKIYF